VSDRKDNLPPAPKREQFADDEAFEEALACWRSHVGRIRGLVTSVSSSNRKEPALRFRGTLIDGPDIDVIKMSGLELTGDEEEKLWSRTTPRQLVNECISCDEMEIERLDDGPGRSDSIYEYVVDDKAKFVVELQGAIRKRLQDA
jgi:hypothetical protein